MVFNRQDGPVYCFVSAVKKSCALFSKTDWSRALAADLPPFGAQHHDTICTLSTLKNSEQRGRKNIRDGLAKHACTTRLNKVICYQSPEDKSNNPSLDSYFVGVLTIGLLDYL